MRAKEAEARYGGPVRKEMGGTHLRPLLALRLARRLPGERTGGSAVDGSRAGSQQHAVRLRAGGGEQGAPEFEGLMVSEFKPWLQAHWPSVRQALLKGGYLPAAVRREEIPKPQGGVRTLGIATVSANCTRWGLGARCALAVVRWCGSATARPE